MIKNKQERILECLKKRGELSQTKIANFTSIHYYSVKICLLNLEKEGKIISRKSKFGTFTYWRIKNEKQN